jgi:predicted nucleotidyltransferase
MTEEIMRRAEVVANDCKAAFGDDLVSVILYGSAVTTEYDAKRSDLNFLVLLSEKGIERLYLAHDLVAKWRKHRVSTPLFLTKAYIESSLDTFPIEFLNIKRNHKLILGEDVLEGMSFKKDFIRMQCERELKGKLLLLRERYVETKGRPKVLKELIAASVPTFIFVFKGLLYLLNKEIPETKQETVTILAQELDLSEALFSSLLQIEAGSLKPSSREIEDIFQRYLQQIRALALLMDEKDFESSPDSAGQSG